MKLYFVYSFQKGEDMLNQIVLVGRIAKGPELKETEKGKKLAYMLLAIPRSFKNVDGEYETDFLNCSLWEGVAKNVCEYCKTGDLVGVKGRLQSDVIEQEDGSKKYYTNIVAEKVTFLSNKKADE